MPLAGRPGLARMLKHVMAFDPVVCPLSPFCAYHVARNVVFLRRYTRLPRLVSVPGTIYLISVGICAALVSGEGVGDRV